MAIESLRDNLDTVAATDQPYNGDSSSQQQLTVYNYKLRGLQFFHQPTTGARTYLHGADTSPGLCNVNSRLGQNQIQIAAEHHRMRSNDTLHYISQMLMEDVDERVDICQGEGALQAAEKPFRDILGQGYTPATYCPPLHSNNETGNSDKSGSSCYKRLWSNSFTDYCSGYSVLRPLTTPLSPYICNTSLSLPNRPLTSVGRCDIPRS